MLDFLNIKIIHIENILNKIFTNIPQNNALLKKLHLEKNNFLS